MAWANIQSFQNSDQSDFLSGVVFFSVLTIQGKNTEINNFILEFAKTECWALITVYTAN